MLRGFAIMQYACGVHIAGSPISCTPGEIVDKA